MPKIVPRLSNGAECGPSNCETLTSRMAASGRLVKCALRARVGVPGLGVELRVPDRATPPRSVKLVMCAPPARSPERADCCKISTFFKQSNRV